MSDTHNRSDRGRGVVRPGGPSAKDVPPGRSSPNHQDDSKETPILAPNALVGGLPHAGMTSQGKGSPLWTLSGVGLGRLLGGAW